MTLRLHEIAETDHRILNPFTEAKLRLLGEIAGVGAGTRILDLACGKGEMLCRYAAWFGSGGVGVDLSHVFLAAARARAEEFGVADRITFVQGDAAAYRPDPGAFDIAACIGAEWIGGGLVGTLTLLRPAVRLDGLILVGTPCWIEEPPAEAVAVLAPPPNDFACLAETWARIDSAGFELLEMVLANRDDWDRYEAMQWMTIDRWLAANSDDPDREAMIRFRDDNRNAYLRWGRRYLGWGVFVVRPW